MGFFDKYPNTDFHEINMDWILAKIQALKDRVKRVEDAVHDIVVVTPNDGKLTIKRNNTIVGDFTANQATDEDINIVVPENTSDLNNDSGFIVSSDLATVATTGDYDDLINTPPTVNDGTLTIQNNGSSVATFTANQSGNVTANIQCEPPHTWSTSGYWKYYKDSAGYYHIYCDYIGTFSVNINTAYGNFYYGTDTWTLPVTGTVIHANVNYVVNNNLVFSTIQGITNNNRILVFLSSPLSLNITINKAFLYVVVKEL